MRLPAPRIAPLGDAELSPEAREVLQAIPEYARGFNIFRTQAHNPDALGAFLAWGNYVLSARNSLTARQRELAILRVGWNCKAGYEWAQHVVIGLNSGIAESEIPAIKAGPDAPGWDPLEAAILRACDELGQNHHIADATWAALAPLGDTGRVDLIYTVGQYTQVSMLLNSCGVQLDPILTADPDLG
ncbi:MULTISPECIES: carboxymuconolactone decarboxylase family protein [unclassified Novosphingobium]|uniref:carboxymuconolactone decarboxylase family protein n=1 Tax=unclassified Novosphingobium TaxID=2644732 RepID=UPI0025ED90B8|nr:MULTISPECIES: carboxymuconolactone decarboxylase family protein [unclassified Novosphingobium]HQV04298.1 carboxymuconolactone decarboxylase family protein [Novosphingobium sp.]